MDLETVTIDGSHELKGHGHTQFHLCVVHGGGFAEHINGGWKECAPGTVRVSPAHAMHQLVLDTAGLHCSMVELSMAAVRGLSRPLHASAYLDSEITGERIARLMTSWSSHDQFGAECAALELAACAVAPPGMAQPPPWASQLNRELSEQWALQYSLAEMANRYDLHRSHVARTFRRWYGRSPGAHQRARRAHLAAVRLTDTDQPLAGMAFDLGFVDQAHFTRVFRTHFGTSPGKYRRAHKSDTAMQLPYKTRSAAHRIHP